MKVDRAKGAGWEVLTKKLHGALSGGEKAIALRLPLFAAIAAHYQAVLDSPRVILLDEVFVGVDAANRGQVFALLAALDLDLVLTSDHEWGDLRATVEELLGPLGDRKARQLQDAADRDQLWDWLFTHPIVKAEPVLRDWAAHLRRSGLVARSVSSTREILQRALDVLEALPADGTPLPILPTRSSAIRMPWTTASG